MPAPSIILVRPGEWVGLAESPVRGTFGGRRDDERRPEGDPSMWEHVVTAAPSVLPSRQDVARAIWNVLRIEDDREDMELEDMPMNHDVWPAADAVLALLNRKVTA